MTDPRVLPGAAPGFGVDTRTGMRCEFARGDRTVRGVVVFVSPAFTEVRPGDGGEPVRVAYSALRLIPRDPSRGTND